QCAAQQGREELLLAVDPVVVTALFAVDVPGPDIVERGLPVDLVASRLREDGAEHAVFEWFAHTHLDAADLVHHLFETGEIDTDEVVDRAACQSLDSGQQASGTTQ